VNFIQSFSPGIAIDLINKDLFLRNQNIFQKLLSKQNDLAFNTPLVIPLQYISGDNIQIFEAIQKKLERYKQCN